ncbi:MAG TPA: FAD-binding protein [Gammaproteobacteria bacterium]|nr:FAD-binding protein [Gammaproteobacteria bacterium]
MTNATTTTLGAAGARALRPRDAADVAEIVASHPRALEPRGGGALHDVGRPLDADVLALDALTGIVTYEPAELVLSARAATPLADIERELAAQSQRLAFEPPDFGPLLGSAAPRTIGGVVAANVAGSRRVSAGAARDHFLGCEAVSGRGERFKAGGRVVKNVTGYDVPKLLAGSWGTLAVLTTVTLRVVPLPESERTLVVPCATPEDAIGILGAALGSPHDVAAAAFDPERGCLLRLEGFAVSVDTRGAALTRSLRRADVAELDGAASRALWAEIGGAAALAPWPVVWKISLPPTDAPRVLAALAPQRYRLDWGGGLIWAALAEADAPRVRAALREGHATLFKAPRAARASQPVFQPQPAALAAAMQRVKHAFDPDGRLSPGRLG